MNDTLRIDIATKAELITALASKAHVIRVTRAIDELEPITLRRGQSIEGVDDRAALSFKGEGIRLTANNQLTQLRLSCPARHAMISIVSDVRDCGTFRLAGLTGHGVVRLQFPALAGQSRLIIDQLAIIQADATANLPHAYGNGVGVLQGALTIWNQSSQGSMLELDAQGIAVGSAADPVRGSGIFVAGTEGNTPALVRIKRFETLAVHADSTLGAETTDTVAGGIFFLAETEATVIATHGDVTTHGANAVPIDNWGKLGSWTIAGDIRSFGPSAVAFVNAGQLDLCEILGVVETQGDGARGCCIYGPTGIFRAQAIRTHGRAAVGVQVVNRLERLEIEREIATSGAAGEGLVKGQMVATPAHGVMVEDGGELGVLDCRSITVASGDAVQIHAPEGTIARRLRP